VRLIPFRFTHTRLHVAGLGVSLVLHHAAAPRTLDERLRPLAALRLAFERFGEHLLRKQLSYRVNRVYQLFQLGAPRQPIRSINAIDKTLRHAFEVRLDRLNDRRHNLFLPGHPWLLSRMMSELVAVSGNFAH
jgi:hypothetical protein